jgi:tRNA nucleotidyltransferase (CCA-adding enzyme)
MLDGGFVRDDLMGNEDSKDVDLEVYGIADYEALLDVLKGCDDVAHVGEAGKVYGVVKARLTNGMELDISLPRRETKVMRGHRGFTVIPDSNLGFKEASERRDFTINAILYDPATNEYVDHHNGVQDLNEGLLRHTSDRFGEDPLRVLRGVQFAARFGFKMAPETVLECRKLTAKYKEISQERIWGEWEKIGTRGKYISTALEVLRETYWLGWYPQLQDMRGIRQDREWHPEGDVWTHAGLAGDQAARLADEAGLTGEDRLVIVLAALCHDMGKVTHTQEVDGKITCHGHADAGAHPTNKFLHSIGCPRDIRMRIIPLVTEHMSTVQPPTPRAVRRLVRRLQPATMEELNLVVGADRKGRGNPDAVNDANAWLYVARNLTIEDKPKPGILNGGHLINHGLTPGPQFKTILDGALQAQDNGEITDEAGALAWLESYVPKASIT